MNAATTAANTTLAAIDRTLHFDTADHDGPGWQPGDPLYDRPHCTADCSPLILDCDCASSVLADYGHGGCPHTCGHQVPRRMIELRLDRAPRLRYREGECGPCQVRWTHDDSHEGPEPPCWNCGQHPDQQNPFRGPLAHYHLDADGTITLHGDLAPAHQQPPMLLGPHQTSFLHRRNDGSNR